jgi:hypothetical protein
MNFDVFGPFRIPRNKAKTLIDDDRLDELSNEVENARTGLSDACGCYVFVIRAAKGYTPWYVGRTKIQTFMIEAFNSANKRKYERVFNDHAGTPMIFFLPIMTAGWNQFRKQNEGLSSVVFLEKWLITEALRKNPGLINLQNTKYLKDLRVRGIFNSQHGESTKDSTELGRAIW